MLLQDQIVEAKEELERALSLQPQDAKSQDLLAGVYFRLGVYPRAIEIWRRLVEAFPRESTLRVNLGLALFKTGQADEALGHLHEALRVQPDHERAWGYLGLVQWRLGRVAEAREAFLRGGQASMARRMEEELGRSSDADDAVTLASREAEESLAARDRAAMRSAAEEAIERLDSERPQLAVEAGVDRRKPSGAWQLAEPGSLFVPPKPPPPIARPTFEPRVLSSLLDDWTVSPPPEVPLSLTEDGTLLLSTETEVCARFSGLVAVRGELRATLVLRRTRGREHETPLGDRDPLMRWRGPVAAAIHAPPGQRFVAARLGEGALFVRESFLFAFDDRVSFETASLPLAGQPVTITQLHGDGVVILALPGAPFAMRVREGEELRVDPERLVGWSGRLFPNARRGTAPYSAQAPALGFRGDGLVLLGAAPEVR
ncbi:MAG: tetratricopeptide repeat protein [Myxococcales bacterium]|nr:tetratricopeptide repeat protein [Myxococcales bacterium]